MHELFESVLAKRDLSRAGQLFALPDDAISHDLSQVLQHVEVICADQGYAASSSDQSLVEIALSRVTGCIREKNNIEEHMAALLSLLDSCLAHDLCPSAEQRDANLLSEYSPHGKVASDLLSCIFLNYDKKWVMQLALPVATKYLLKGNAQLVRNVTSFLCLTSSDHRELLSHQAGVLLQSVAHGNEDLLRVLPALFPYNGDVFVRHAVTLATTLGQCKDPENKNHCLQVLSLVGAETPDSLVGHVGVFLGAIDAASSVFAAPALCALAHHNVAVFADHLGLLRSQLQPLWPGMLPALLSILGGLSRTRHELLHECCGLLVFYLEHLPRLEQSLDVLKALEQVSASAGPLMAPFVGRIERAARALGPGGASLVALLKAHARRSGKGGPLPSPTGAAKLHVGIQTEDPPLPPPPPPPPPPPRTPASVTSEPPPDMGIQSEAASGLQTTSSVRLPPSSTPRSHRPASVSTVLQPPGAVPGPASAQAAGGTAAGTNPHVPRTRSRPRSSASAPGTPASVPAKHQHHHQQQTKQQAKHHHQQQTVEPTKEQATEQAPPPPPPPPPPVVDQPEQVIQPTHTPKCHLQRQPSKQRQQKQQLVTAPDHHQLTQPVEKPPMEQDQLPPQPQPQPPPQPQPQDHPLPQPQQLQPYESAASSSLTASRSRFSSQVTNASRLESVSEQEGGPHPPAEPHPHAELHPHLSSSKSAPKISGSCRPASPPHVARSQAALRQRRSLCEASAAANALLPPYRQPSQRDAIRAFSEKHAPKMAAFIENLLPRLPVPTRCAALREGQRHARSRLVLHFSCMRNTLNCVCSGPGNSLTVVTKHPRTWVHIVFLAHQANTWSRSGAVAPGGLNDPVLAELRGTWEGLRAAAQCRFVALVTSSFPAAKDMELLRRELAHARFFDRFEFHEELGHWACYLCRQPVPTFPLPRLPPPAPLPLEVAGGIGIGGIGGFSNGASEAVGEAAGPGSSLTVQLKQKRGRLKFLRRWKTRYFTLSGAHIICSKQRRDAAALDFGSGGGVGAHGRAGGSLGGGHLPVASIQSVKVVRRRHRDHLPKAYEIFTDGNRKLLVKPVGDDDVEGWVRQLQYFVARNQNTPYGMPPPAMDLGSTQNNSVVGAASSGSHRQKQSCL